MHGRDHRYLLPSEETTTPTTPTAAALWVILGGEAKLLGSTKALQTSHAAQHSTMLQSYRFMNSDMYFDDKALMVLLRLLEGNTLTEREKWWLEVSCYVNHFLTACKLSRL